MRKQPIQICNFLLKQYEYMGMGGAEFITFKAYMRKEYKKTVIKLEKEKLDIKKALEREMKRFAKLSKNDKLAKRHGSVGKAPNDWKDDDKIWSLLAD